jgi:hypothetical protein
VVVALCGDLLCPEEIEMVGPGMGLPCTACLASRAIAIGSSAADCEGRDAEIAGGPLYSGWGWPVTQHRDLIALSLDCDASALAIPIPLSVEVTRVLTARHCAPAVLAHPYAPEHHMVLTGEKFGAALPLAIRRISGKRIRDVAAHDDCRWADHLGTTAEQGLIAVVPGDRRLRRPAHGHSRLVVALRRAWTSGDQVSNWPARASEIMARHWAVVKASTGLLAPSLLSRTPTDAVSSVVISTHS